VSVNKVVSTFVVLLSKKIYSPSTPSSRTSIIKEEKEMDGWQTHHNLYS